MATVRRGRYPEVESASEPRSGRLRMQSLAVSANDGGTMNELELKMYELCRRAYRVLAYPDVSPDKDLLLNDLEDLLNSRRIDEK